MKQKLTLVFLMIVLTLGVSCSDKEDKCNPFDQGGSKMKVEYDYQEDYEIGSMEGLFGNVQGAFKSVGTEITICSIAGEPPFLPDDTTFFTDDGLIKYVKLNTFFDTHKTSGLVYYLVSVDGLDVNAGLPPYERIWGCTKPSAPNVPPNPKWSFIFVGDIPEEYYGGRWTKHRLVTATTIHELGHQRAGLTHPHEYPQYHHPNYPCIMTWSNYVTNEVLTTMGFCWSSDPNSPDNCRYFLQQQNK
jgi:hypothetical protein